MEGTNNENKLTDEQVSTLYNRLDNEIPDQARKAMEESKIDTVYKNDLEEAELTEESIFGAMTPEEADEFAKQQMESIKEDKNDYIEALESYGITDNDAEILFDMIMRYKNGEDAADLYEIAPATFKQTVEQIICMTKATTNKKVSKKSVTKDLLENFINDAKFSKAIDEYQQDISDTMIGMNKDFELLYKETMDEAFNNIEKIREENPEYAEKLEKFDSIFKDAESFQKQLDYLDRINNKKLMKFVNNYEGECGYFNKKVNTTTIKVPDIHRVYNVVRKAFSGFTDLQIKAFVVVIIKTSYNLDMNNLDELAYIFRLVSSITSYDFITVIDEETLSNNLFTNIKKVIQKIISLE